MGVWGVEPWQGDGAVAWFQSFLADLDVGELRAALQDCDDHEAIRAACYVLQCFGRPGVWPQQELDALIELLDRGIELLSNMLQPPNEDWDFLELCDHKPDLIRAVQAQLDELRARRGGIAL